MKKIIKCITVFAVTIGMIFSTNIITHAVNTNLALNKTTTASDVESGTNFTANLAVDGNSSTRWASNPDYGATKSPKWLKIDFGVTTTFDMVDVQWEQQNIQSFQLQVSDNDSEWQTIYERNTAPNSKLDSVTFEAAITARYLRVYATNYNGSWPSVSIFEVGVYNSKEVPVEPTNNYQIYPIPQKVTDYDSAIDLTKEINIIKEEGIDEITKARIDEVLTNHQLVPTYSQERASDKTNLYIGINGSNGSADLHQDVPKDVFVEGENKYDMHVVKVFDEGDIVILGKDSDAAFYALATLEQMLDQSQDNKLKVSVFEDYAFQKYRGAVEGYYGYPWSVDGTLSWFDYAKRYKMNIFLYGPKSDPYHLGKWDEDYPLEVSAEDAKNGVRTKDEMEQYARKAAACKVDFVWVAHPAMQKPIDFTNETTIAEGIDRLMTKFDHMYQLGVRQFGIFVDDISDSEAARTCDMQIYMLNQVQDKLYERYNQENSSVESKVKPLFFTPAWYTTNSSGAASNLPKFKNIHQDIEICFTGNNVFSSISNSSATTFKNWIGRTPVMWWNYPVNDAEDSVFFTNPINKAGYTQDPNPTNIKGVLSNPMNFSEASKVSFFGLADYTWNPQKFDAQENWEHSFDAIIPDDQEMAKALKVAYGNLNDDYVPMEVQKVISNYSRNDKTSQIKLKDKMFEIMDAISKIETLKDSDNPAYRLIVEEAQTSFNKLYDMAEAIGGAMAVISSDDPVEQMQGYYMANAANERLNIPRNKRYQIISLEGAGEDIYNSVLQATASDAGLKPFVNTAIATISDFDPTGLDTSIVKIDNIQIEPSENVVVKQGNTCQFLAQVTANYENVNEVNWLVEGATGKDTIISKNGILTVDKNELSPVITIKAISAYDNSKIASVSVAVTDREYIDPTIPVNLGPSAAILGASGNAAKGEGPENIFDDLDTTKWCPGNSTNYNQWLAFDLGSVKQISRWQLVGGGIENALYIPSAYSLQVLKDPNPSESDLKNTSYLGNSANWEIVAEYTNNKENVTNYNFNPNIEGRYFRLFIANASQPGAPYPATRIFETRIYGVDKDVVARTHKLSIDENIVNGSITTDAKNYEEGAKVNIGVHPESGYQLKEGTLKFNDTLINGTSFIMPDTDVIITAQFENISTSDTYTIQIGTLEHGNITVDKETAREGEIITLDINPNSGYQLKEGTLKYNDELINGNSFIMPNTNVVITAQFEKTVVTTDKIALSIALDMAKSVTQEQLDKVVPVVANEFKAALQNAQNVFDNAKASREEVDNAFDRLAKVMQMLEFYKGDKAALQKMMDQIASLSANDYTDSTWKALQAVLPGVNEVLGNVNAMQEEVDE
ncbi:beta-N-acetylglucosaminidase domain-containing protein, partial [Thomasclavelia sp.]